MQKVQAEIHSAALDPCLSIKKAQTEVYEILAPSSHALFHQQNKDLFGQNPFFLLSVLIGQYDDIHLSVWDSYN